MRNGICLAVDDDDDVIRGIKRPTAQPLNYIGKMMVTKSQIIVEVVKEECILSMH